MATRRKRNSMASKYQFVVEILKEPLPHKEYRVFEDGKLLKSFNELSNDYAYMNAMAFYQKINKK
jgi:hypothetical protein